MALVIKKQVDLGSLGSEYEGISITFKSVPSKDLSDIASREKAAGKSVVPVVIEVLTEQFISGKQDSEDLSEKDMGELDAKALTYCYKILVGGDVDPKQSSSLSTQSTTEPQNPQS